MLGKHSLKSLFLAILFLVSAAVLFSSDSRQDGISFRIVHEVNVDSSFFSEYRTPGTGTKITEAPKFKLNTLDTASSVKVSSFGMVLSRAREVHISSVG